MSAEGFPDHVTTDGFLLGVPGRGACGGSVVQLDHDEVEFMRGDVQNVGCQVGGSTHLPES